MSRCLFHWREPGPGAAAFVDPGAHCPSRSTGTMANTRTESHIPRGVTVLLVAAGDHRIRLLELLQPDDGIEIDVIEPGPSASAAVSAQQHGFYLIDETAAGGLELLPH